MVSSVDSSFQRPLDNTKRRGNNKPAVKKRVTYEDLSRPGFDENDEANFRMSTSNLNNGRSKQPQSILRKKQTSQSDQFIDQIGAPSQFRNNTSRITSPAFNGNVINPLPSIVSPYVSARASVPNLESWGVANHPFDFDSGLYRDTGSISPFLPVYNSITRAQKPYVVVPKLTQRMYRVPSPIGVGVNLNSRLNYIQPIPYQRPIDFSTSLADRFYSASPVQFSVAEEASRLKSDALLKSAHNVISNTNKKAVAANGNELFSTDFLDGLEYRPDPASMRITQAASARSSTPPPNPIDPDYPSTVAEDYLRAVKADALLKVPKVNYTVTTSKTFPSAQEMISKATTTTTTVDIAENVYSRDIEDMVRSIARNMVEEEHRYYLSLQNPIYNSIYEKTLNEMVREVAGEALKDHSRQVQFLQTHEIKKVAKEQLTDKLMLDHMLETVALHGKIIAENDDVSKLLDTMTMDVLLHQNGEVRRVKEKTTKNYPFKKFHLNTFMTVAQDILVNELQTALEEDMKELEEIEKKS